jgi:hypothetical protein
MIIVPTHHFRSMFYLLLNECQLDPFKYNSYSHSSNWTEKCFRVLFTKIINLDLARDFEGPPDPKSCYI